MTYYDCICRNIEIDKKSTIHLDYIFHPYPPYYYDNLFPSNSFLTSEAEPGSNITPNQPITVLMPMAHKYLQASAAEAICLYGNED